jgi:hypothetical protein
MESRELLRGVGRGQPGYIVLARPKIGLVIRLCISGRGVDYGDGASFGPCSDLAFGRRSVQRYRWPCEVGIEVEQRIALVPHEVVRGSGSPSCNANCLRCRE